MGGSGRIVFALICSRKEFYMITTKQRAYLRSIAAQLTPIMQVGKNGITDNLVKTLSDSLEAHEIIKLTVLEACPMTAREVSDALCIALSCEAVQTIGRKITLYRQASEKEKRKIVLPKEKKQV